MNNLNTIIYKQGKNNNITIINSSTIYNSSDDDSSDYSSDNSSDVDIKNVINKKNLKKINNKVKPIYKNIRKKTIPSTVKRLVWNNYIGENIGKSKCYCCKLTDITQLSFHCGHIISEKNGGKVDINNLRPICQNCNSSMGTTNMNDFINKYKLH
jgi:hypothetical protein